MKSIRVFIALFLQLFRRLEILPNERLKKKKVGAGEGGERAGSWQPKGDVSLGRQQRLQEGGGSQGLRGG